MNTAKFAGVGLALVLLVAVPRVLGISHALENAASLKLPSAQLVEHQAAALLACTHRGQRGCGELTDADIAVRELTNGEVDAFVAGRLRVAGLRPVAVALHLRLARAACGWQAAVVSP